MQPEAKLTKNIIVNLKGSFGGWWTKIHGGPFQAAGIPDIIGICKPKGKKWGRLFGLEVKMPGKEKTLTRIQAITLSRIQKAGGITAVVTSVEQATQVVEEGLK